MVLRVKPLLIIVGYVCVMIPPCLGSKILMLAAQQVSHVNGQSQVGEVLVRRGHEVYTLLDTKYPKADAVKKAGITPIFYEEPAGVDTFLTHQDGLASFIFSPGNNGLSFSDIVKTIDIAKATCDRILHNAPLMDDLKSRNFDLIITDGFVLAPCLFVISHNISAPYVYLFGAAPELTIGIPSLPSFSVSPQFSLFSPFGMTITEKMKQISYEFMLKRVLSLGADDRLLHEFAPGVDSVWDLVRRSQIFFITRDHLLEWPSLSLPNVIRLPGITGKSAEQLPGDLQSLLDNSGTAALLAFGSSVEDMPIGHMRKFLDAMRQVKDVTFLFRMSDKLAAQIDDMPSNVKPMKWLPQNDVLAHRNLKLFITHCGNNGQYESIYNGVPMIGFPLFAEQHHNCMRIEAHKMGTCFKVNDFNSTDLTRAINMVLGSKEFNDNVIKMQQILKKGKYPRETAADWIEHVIEFGGDHLRSASQEMPLYEMLMLDILALVLVAAILFVIITFYLLTFLWRCIRGTKHSIKTKSA